MRFGLFLPPFDELAEPRRVSALARSAEDAGWDGLFLWDHILAEPGMPVADSWITMAAIAAATSRIWLGAFVTPLSRRRPWVLARQIATLDRLSEGRLVVGIGLGDDGWREFSSFNEVTEPSERGQVLDEALELLQRLLAGEPVHYSGEHYAVESTEFLPRAVQQPVPIWAAVRWPNRKPLARAARLNGCFPIFPAAGPPRLPDPADVRAIREQLARLGTGPGYDLVVRSAGLTERREEIAELEQAGVTWTLAGFGPGQPAAQVEAVVFAGPPS